MKKLLLILTLAFAPLASAMALDLPADTLLFVYKLHGQTRKYKMKFSEIPGGKAIDWKILRNGHWQQGRYEMSEAALRSASAMSFRQPVDGELVVLPDTETFGIVPADFLQQLKRDGRAAYDSTIWQLAPSDDSDSHVSESVASSMPTSPVGAVGDGIHLLHVRDTREGAEMWILDNPSWPIIWRMSSNPLEINWTTQPLH